MSRTTTVVLGVIALLVLLALAGDGPWWMGEGIFRGHGLHVVGDGVGGVFGAIAGVLGAIVGLVVGGIVLLAVLPLVLLAVVGGLLLAVLAVGAALLFGLAPLLLPVALVIGLVWLVARASRGSAPALPPPA